MQQPPPAHKLHWSPVPPSWFVSGGLLVLAVMPHQIPTPIRRVLLHPAGAVLVLVIAAWLSRQTPVLAAALVLVLAGLWFTMTAEPFVAPILNKDVVDRKRKWLGEEIMHEEPQQIQERTENPAFLKDEIGREEAQVTWHNESVMGERPVAIQERPVPNQYENDYDYHDEAF